MLRENKFDRNFLLSLDSFTLYKLLKDSYYDRLLGIESFLSYDDIHFLLQLSLHSSHFKLAKRKYNNLCQKRVRIKKSIEKILKNDCIFLTLTFDSKHIDMVSKRRKINEWLRKLKCNYIGNVDYGDINGRMHYHVIVQTDYVDYSSYIYGDIDGKRIYNKNVEALKKYIVKLSNHACKESTKNDERILKCFKYDS